MPNFCIPSNKAKEFREALKSGALKISDLVNSESLARQKMLEQFVGTEAKKISTLIEEKLILKNRETGLKNVLSQLGQIGRYDPMKKAKIAESLSEFRAKQQERIFSPKEYESFLGDLAEKILGIDVTRAEAKTIFDLQTSSDKILENNFNKETNTWRNDKVKMEYGVSKVILDKYIESLKGSDLPLKEILKGRLQEFKQAYKENKVDAIMNIIGDAVKTITQNSISTVATLDNSFLGRQGLKTLMTHPSAWWEGAKNSFKDIAGTLKGNKMEDALMAELYSDPLYMDGTYKLADIISKTEEQFPTSLPERIPVVGRLFKASEVAFKGSAQRMRTQLYKQLSKTMEGNKIDMKNPENIKGLGKMINSLTARGKWGKMGEPPIVRMFLWAPRMLKGNIDVLTAHMFDKGVPSFVRKEAAINLTKLVVETAIVMTIANAIKPNSAELDPRSSDFGKIKTGDTRFDITGGASSLIVLASRLAMALTGNEAYKSSSTGVKSKLGSGYGQTSMFDVVMDFLTNKTTPPMRVILDILKGENFKGEKPTLGKELYSTTVPISIQGMINLKDNASADRILGVLTDAVGISSTSYTKSETDWSQNMGVELSQFKQKVGDAKFKEANDKYNQEVIKAINLLSNNPKFKSLPSEQQKTVLTNKKNEIRDNILKSYGFKYKALPKVKVPKF